MPYEKELKDAPMNNIQKYARMNSVRHLPSTDELESRLLLDEAVDEEDNND